MLLHALLTGQAARYEGLGLQAQPPNHVAAIDASPIVALDKPLQGGFAGMQFFKVAAGIGKVAGRLVISDRGIAAIPMMAQGLADLRGIAQRVIDLMLKLCDSGLEPGPGIEAGLSRVRRVARFRRARRGFPIGVRDNVLRHEGLHCETFDGSLLLPCPT